MLDSSSGAPKDYEELFVHYVGFVRAKVARAGIDSQDVEDVASEILIRFMERDGLSWYDPEKLFDTGENPRVAGPRHRPAKFHGILASYVSKSLRHYWDKQNKAKHREPIRNEAPVAATDGVGETLWIEVFSSSGLDDYEAMEAAADTVASAGEFLESLEVRGSRDLGRAFEMCRKQMATDGRIDRGAIADAFGVSNSVVCAIFAEMRAALRAGGFYTTVSAT